MGDRKVPFLDLFEVRMAPVSSREEEGMKLLKKEVAVAVAKPTGVVQVSIRTRWPSVSLAIISQLINGVNDFNQRTRQSQAAAERAFLEARLATANLDLSASEARLGEFMRANRQYANSPQLSFQHDNLQADVDLKRRLLTTLTQAYEDARIREVRDTPVITIIEAPTVSMLPEPRGRLKAVLLGFVLGGFLGVVVAFLRAVIARARMANDPAVETFFATLEGVWRGLVPARFRRERRGA